MIKYSDVYECELEKDRIFKKSKVYLCLICLVTIALLMSFVSQNFYWGFALFIGLPIYFVGMNLLYRYQANSNNANQNGFVCLVCSVIWIFGFTGLFIYLYMTSYGPYFAQKYTATWCRGYSIEQVDVNKMKYYSITYELIDDKDEYELQRGITNDNYNQNTTPTPLPSQTYGCGCISNKKKEASVKGLHGYDYSFKDDGSLNNLPYWLCDTTATDEIPSLQDYSEIYRCYVHKYNSPTQEDIQDPNVCKTGNSFAQVTFDSPPYYSYQQFLYMIGFIFMSIFGVAMNFPMTYLLLKIQYRSIVVKNFQQPTDRRKILICYALKKALIFDRIQQQLLKHKESNLQCSILPANTPILKKKQTNQTQSQSQSQYSRVSSCSKYLQDQRIPENLSISVFRKEILDELLEFLYTDNVHYHIVKRKLIQMQRNRAISNLANSQNNNGNNEQLGNNNQNPEQNENQTVININQLLNIQDNQQINQLQVNAENQNIILQNSQQPFNQNLQIVNQTNEEEQALRQNQQREFDNNKNELNNQVNQQENQVYSLELALQQINGRNYQENKGVIQEQQNNINKKQNQNDVIQNEIEQNQCKNSEENRKQIQQIQRDVFNNIQQQDIEDQQNTFDVQNYKFLSSKQQSNADLYKSEDYKDEDDYRYDNLYCNRYDSRNSRNDLNILPINADIEQRPKLKARTSSYLPPLLQNISNQDNYLNNSIDTFQENHCQVYPINENQNTKTKQNIQTSEEQNRENKLISNKSSNMNCLKQKGNEIQITELQDIQLPQTQQNESNSPNQLVTKQNNQIN